MNRNEQKFPFLLKKKKKKKDSSTTTRFPCANNKNQIEVQPQNQSDRLACTHKKIKQDETVVTIHAKLLAEEDRSLCRRIGKMCVLLTQNKYIYFIFA